jgi:Mg2+ and Co2+ transporter CorA
MPILPLLTPAQLRDTLELKNQKELAKINNNLLSLQRESVDDNETVKVITVLTLIYLPGSFVAVSLCAMRGTGILQPP